MWLNFVLFQKIEVQQFRQIDGFFAVNDECLFEIQYFHLFYGNHQGSLKLLGKVYVLAN